MARYTIKYTKTKNLKFISHLDTLRVMQRAISRVNLPICYSEGYNPHMKMSFGYPISLGVESVGEYFEIELSEEVDTMKIAADLGDSLPLNMKIVDCIKYEEKDSLMARTAFNDYSIVLDEFESTLEELEKVTNAIVVDGIEYTKIRKKKKKPKICNTKDYIDNIEVLGCEGKMAALNISFKLTETGSMKVSEVVDMLKENNVNFKYYSAIKLETYDENRKPLINR